MFKILKKINKIERRLNSNLITIICRAQYRCFASSVAHFICRHLSNKKLYNEKRKNNWPLTDCRSNRSIYSLYHPDSNLWISRYFKAGCWNSSYQISQWWKFVDLNLVGFRNTWLTLAYRIHPDRPKIWKQTKLY